jgi:hypothetical protein
MKREDAPHAPHQEQRPVVTALQVFAFMPQHLPDLLFAQHCQQPLRQHDCGFPQSDGDRRLNRA